MGIMLDSVVAGRGGGGAPCNMGLDLSRVFYEWTTSCCRMPTYPST